MEGVTSTFRPAGGPCREPFLAPGSALYQDCVWDWDSWLADVALRRAVLQSTGSSLLEPTGEPWPRLAITLDRRPGQVVHGRAMEHSFPGKRIPDSPRSSKNWIRIAVC